MCRAFLVLLLLTSPAWSQPLTLPAEIKGLPGSFISVPAKTDGKTVRWVVLDNGLQLFPVELLRDSKTAVVTGPTGTYRVLAYTSIKDVPSEPAICVVTIGTPNQPPPQSPPPPPQAPPELTNYYFLIVRDDGPASPAFSKIMADPAWADVVKAGHSYKDKTRTDAEKILRIPVPPILSLPQVFRLRVKGGVSTIVGDPFPLPTTSEGIRKLLETP